MITLDYNSEDAIRDLKCRVEASHSCPINMQQFYFSRNVPGDPIEEVGDASLVRDFASRLGTLRLDLKAPGEASAEADQVAKGKIAEGPQHSTPNNKLWEVRTTDSAAASVGQYYSEAAVTHLSGKTLASSNEVRTAVLEKTSTLIVGERFGGVDLV